MPDEPDPPRKNYGFKEREFKRDNAPASAAPPPPTAKELAMMSGPVTATPKSATGQRAEDPNDVYAVLQENRRSAREHGLNEVEVKAVKSRRTRDYWLLLLSAELALGVTAYLGRGNPFILACAVGGMGLVALGLTWIMWQVMNKY